jgi:F-type H+-transporting ATPase subunit delta
MPAGTESAARRYANAAFEFAESAGGLDEWERDLDLLAQIFRPPEVLPWLANPSVPLSEKESLIEIGLAFASQEARNFGRLLITRGRAPLAEQILTIFRGRLDETRGIAHALVTTAVPLAEADITAIAARLAVMTGRQVKIEPVVDPSIVGGIVVRIGDRLIDASAKARLVALKRRLAGTAP